METGPYCWWQPEIRRENLLRLVKYPMIYKVLYIPRACLGFLPSIYLPIQWTVDFYGKLVGKYTGLVPWMLWDWINLFNRIIQQPNSFTVSNLSCVPSEESGFMSFHQLEYPQKTKPTVAIKKWVRIPMFSRYLKSLDDSRKSFKTSSWFLHAKWISISNSSKNWPTFRSQGLFRFSDVSGMSTVHLLYLQIVHTHTHTHIKQACLFFFTFLDCFMLNIPVYDLRS